MLSHITCRLMGQDAAVCKTVYAERLRVWEKLKGIGRIGIGTSQCAFSFFYIFAFIWKFPLTLRLNFRLLGT